MRFLFAIMHPRRLDFFLRSINAIDYVDVLLAKNYELTMAQNMIRNYFLTHDYDYLLFTSDDTEIPYEAPKQIMDDIEKYRFNIITGWSRIRPQVPHVNITLNAPPLIEQRKNKAFLYSMYNFVTVTEIKEMLRNGKTIIPIWFVGWSLTAMSRKSIQEWTPRGWYFDYSPPYHLEMDGLKGSWKSSDLWYSYNMYKKGYQAYCDLRVHVPHYPPRFKYLKDELLVGKEPPKLEFRKAEKPLFFK